MENFIAFDESKLSDNSMYCFSGILFRNVEVFLRSEFEFIRIKEEYKKNNGNNEFELKGSKIGASVSPITKKFLIELFSYLRTSILNGESKIFFYIMHKDDLQYANVDLTKVIEGVMKKVTNIDSDEIFKYIYSHLSSFLIKRLPELTFKDEVLKYAICDNVYNLKTNCHSIVESKGNIFSMPSDTSLIVAEIIERVHNLLPEAKQHHGFTTLDFFDSTDIVTIQLCDILSNFLLNSIRYEYYNSINDLENKAKYKFKYDFINEYVFKLNIPLTQLPLSLKNNELTANRKFDAIMGKL